MSTKLTSSDKIICAAWADSKQSNRSKKANYFEHAIKQGKQPVRKKPPA